MTDEQKGKRSAETLETPAAQQSPKVPRKDAPSPHMDGVRHVVLDIEGTTTPISFVADVLFPYARTKLEAHLDAQWETDEFQADLDALRKSSREDHGDVTKVVVPDGADAKREDVRKAVVDFVTDLMDADKKVGALKQLQGHIWRAGYASGELKGQLFDDVHAALLAWREANVPVSIYSSGSIAAQKLLFAHSDAGDVTPLLAGHYDTTSGQKVDAESYRTIAKALELADAPESILFLTDRHGESVAADAAGWRTLLLNRPGNGKLPEDNKFPVIDDFASLHC